MAWHRPIVRDGLWLFAIVLIAVGLRVAWVVRAETFPVPGMDPLFYTKVAQRLADGLGYTHPQDANPTALFPPGYSFALGGVYKVFGPGLATGQAFTIVLSVAIVLATYGLGMLMFGRLAGLVGAFIWAVFPSQVVWSSLLMPEMIFTLGLLLSLVCLLLSNRASSTRDQLALAALSGAFAGAASLIRGQAIGLWLVVLILLLIARHPHWLRKTALYAIAMVLVLTPWTVRNARELNAFVPVSTNVGWNAVIGHHDRADGGFWSPASIGVFDTYIKPNPAGEIQRNEAGVRMARDWALDHPQDELRLAVNKTVILWGDDDDAVIWQELGRVPAFMGTGERTTLIHLSNVFYYAMLVAAGLGLISARRRDPTGVWLVALLALYWTAFHIAFFSENRFHYPLTPLLSVTAGVGVVTAARWGLAGLRARGPGPGSLPQTGSVDAKT